MATGHLKLRQRKIIGIGEIYESFITALPLLSAVQFLSILTLLYNDLQPYLVEIWPSISLLKFLLILSVLMVGAMVLVYRFLIPSIWTFRGKQLYGFESQLMDEVVKLRQAVDKLSGIVATTQERQEQHDCSNCRFRQDVAPYSVILGCSIDMENHLQPYTCNRWASVLDHIKEET